MEYSGFSYCRLFFLGLAVLTKGPVAVLVFGLSFFAYFILKKARVKLVFSQIALFLIVLAITGGFWFILQIASGHSKVIIDFINYQVKLFSTKDAGHGGFLFYHFVVILIGLFPTAVFAIPMLIKKDRGGKNRICMHSGCRFSSGW